MPSEKEPKKEKREAILRMWRWIRMSRPRVPRHGVSNFSENEKLKRMAKGRPSPGGRRGGACPWERLIHRPKREEGVAHGVDILIFDEPKSDIRELVSMSRILKMKAIRRSSHQDSRTIIFVGGGYRRSGGPLAVMRQRHLSTPCKERSAEKLELAMMMFSVGAVAQI